MKKDETRAADADVADEVVEHPVKPSYTLTAGHSPEAVDFAEETLHTHCQKLFQRGGSLVRVGRVEKDELEKPVRRVAGSVNFFQVEPVWLTEQLARTAIWYRQGKKGPIEIDPPQWLARGVLIGRAGEWKAFRTVSGIMRAPTILPDGTLLQRPGYDERSRVFFDFGEDEFRSVPEAPDEDDVAKAKRWFERLFVGFPFKTDVDRAVAMSAVLSGLVRPFMEACPLHGFDAPVPGTGKSLLAKTIGIIIAGNRPPAAAQGKTEEEDEKRLVSVLHKGDPVLLVDNCERPLRGQMLCQMLTEQSVTSRLLGTNLMATLSTRILVMATGNNIAVSGDMSRRAVICRLDAGMEKPERREFDFDPTERATRKRSLYVRSALILLKAWYQASMPNKLSAGLGNGGYDDWTNIRAALVYHGYADPLQSQERLAEGNEVLIERKELVSRWTKVYDDQPLSLAMIHSECGVEGVGKDNLKLYRLLCEMTRDGKWNAVSIGKRLARHLDAPITGFVLRSKQSRAGVRLFYVEKTP